MDKRFELILHEVRRKFRSERAFYHSVIGITQRAWEKYKSGETDFDNIKLSTYKRMINSLFTPYEVMLIDEAIQATNFNWYASVVGAFHEIKVKHAKRMLDRGATIEKSGARMSVGDGKHDLYNPITIINIVDELDLQNRNIVSFHIYPDGLPRLPEEMHLRIPSGKRNRREWFNKYFDEVVVK